MAGTYRKQFGSDPFVFSPSKGSGAVGDFIPPSLPWPCFPPPPTGHHPNGPQAAQEGPPAQSRGAADRPPLPPLPRHRALPPSPERSFAFAPNLRGFLSVKYSYEIHEIFPYNNTMINGVLFYILGLISVFVIKLLLPGCFLQMHKISHIPNPQVPDANEVAAEKGHCLPGIVLFLIGNH